MQLTRRELLQGTTALGLASVLPRAHARGSLTVLEFGAAYVEASITLADVPNLVDVPERFITKDDKGNIKNVPRSVNGGFFAVRTDTCPIEIKTIEDLLNPRLKGQISWPVPTAYSNMATVTLALAR